MKKPASEHPLRSEDSLREKARVLEIVNKTGLAVASQLSIDALLQLVTDSATQLVGAEFGAFFYNTVNEHGDAFMLYALSGADPKHFEHLPLPRATALFGTTFRGEAVVRAHDVLLHPAYGKSSPHFGMPPQHLPVRSYLAVPVIGRDGTVFGGLFFGHSAVGIFSEEHESAVVLVAARADCPSGRLPRRLRTASSRTRTGACARTARASGPAC